MLDFNLINNLKNSAEAGLIHSIASRGLGLALGGIAALAIGPFITKFIDGRLVNRAIEAEGAETIRHFESNIKVIDDIISQISINGCYDNSVLSVLRLHFDRLSLITEIFQISPNIYKGHLPFDSVRNLLHSRATARNLDLDCKEINVFLEHVGCEEIVKYLEYLSCRFKTKCADLSSRLAIHSKFLHNRSYIYQNSTIIDASVAKKSSEIYFIKCPTCAQNIAFRRQQNLNK